MIRPMKTALPFVACLLASFAAHAQDPVPATPAPTPAIVAPAEPPPVTTIAPVGRPVIGVLKFQDETGAMFMQGGVGRALTTMLTNELSARPAFTVVERQKLRAVLEEQNLSQSGRVSAESSIAIGKLTGAQYLITGTVTAFEERIQGPTIKRGGLFGSRVTVTAPPSAGGYLAVDLRVIDTTTGEIRHARTIEGTTAPSADGSIADDPLVQGPDQRAVRAAVIEIVDYLQCAMVVRDACLATFEAKDRRRQETTRGAVEIKR
jgi:curli biogenesis system outer membrane secretion channel CsgG